MILVLDPASADQPVGEPPGGQDADEGAEAHKRYQQGGDRLGSPNLRLMNNTAKVRTPAKKKYPMDEARINNTFVRTARMYRAARAIPRRSGCDGNPSCVVASNPCSMLCSAKWSSGGIRAVLMAGRAASRLPARQRYRADGRLVDLRDGAVREVPEDQRGEPGPSHGQYEQRRPPTDGGTTAGYDDAEACADQLTGEDESVDATPFVGGEEVPRHRGHRGSGGGRGAADRQLGDHEGGKGSGKGTLGHRHRPDGQPDQEQPAPVEAIGQDADGNCEHGSGDRTGRDQQPQAYVVDMKGSFHFLRPSPRRLHYRPRSSPGRPPGPG